MASAAEHLASSISFANFQKATELKKRLWFTIGALILFRLLSFVPVPGIDPVAMTALYQTQSGGILDVFNTFSGGALSASRSSRWASCPTSRRRLSFSSARRSTGRGRRSARKARPGARSSTNIPAT